MRAVSVARTASASATSVMVCLWALNAGKAGLAAALLDAAFRISVRRAPGQVPDRMKPSSSALTLSFAVVHRP